LLDDVVEKAIRLALEIVEKKNPSLSEAERKKVAEAVGIGALKYNDLKENRTTDIVFDWRKMLDLSGDSAPYLQYTYARLRSILRKISQGSRVRGQESSLNGEIELALMRRIFEFPDEIIKSARDLQTSNLANYLYKLAILANRFYETTPVLKEENESRRHALLVLVSAVAAVLRNGLGLLGIRTPEEI
jgi:arginyl-tRNA synthetase